VARVQLKSQPWGWFVNEDGRPAQGQTPTFTDPSGAAATVYLAATGATTTTPTSDAEGLATGWIEEGTYTLTDDDGNTQTVEAVAGKPLGIVNVKSYGAKGDGSTDDSTAITNAIAALPVNGGTLHFPPGDYVCASSLNLDDKRSIILQGAGGRSAGASVTTRITYSGTGSGRFLSCRSCYGISIRDMWVAYSSGSYTGNLIDFSHSDTGGDGAYHSIERCLIGGTGSSTRTAVGVNVNKSQTSSITDSFVINCDIGVKGKSVNGDYAASWKIDTVAFNTNTTAHIRNAGNAWLVQNCTFESLASGAAGAYSHDANVICNGITFISNWTGDVTSGTAAQFTVAGTDIVFIGNEIQSNGSGTGISIDNGLTNSTGIVITGNRFNSLTNGIVVAAKVTNNYTLAGIDGADVDWVGDPGSSTNLKTTHSIESALNIKAGAGGYFNGGGSTAGTTQKIAFGVGAEANARFTSDASGKFAWGDGTNAVDASLNRPAASQLQVLTADLLVGTAGRGLRVKEGSNAKMGTATLNGSTEVTISNTSVTTNSRILLTIQSPGGTVGSPYVSSRSAGTSFGIKSTNASDSSTVAYHIIEPA
jgi:hypothetical protein